MKTLILRTLATGLLLTAFAPGATAGEWVELSPATGPSPSPRIHPTSIYDPIGHRMIVFGGNTSQGDVGDVWAFDLTAGTWSQLSTGSGPTGRITANALYDDLNHRMLLWSGQASGVFNNDVWAFDLTTNGWTELTPADPKPNIRYGTAAVLDPVTRDVVTFAGFTSAGRFDDTWRFSVDDVTWTDESPAADPGRRCLHAAVLDARDRRMIIYGGQRSGALGDIWALDLATGLWTEMLPDTRPANRFFLAKVYDVWRHTTMIFGGNTNGSRSNETWLFDLDNESWTELTPAGTNPAGRDGPTAIFVPNEDRMVMFGGGTPTRQGDVWAFELSPGESLTFPGPVVAPDTDTFAWPMQINADWVRGPLATVDSYATDVVDTAIWTTTVNDVAVPAAGEGWWYLMRLSGNRGTWQSAQGAEPARDTNLP